MQTKLCQAVPGAMILVALIVGALGTTAQAAPTLETFAAPEEMKDAVLSPDGRYLAVISTADGIRVVLVRDLREDGKFAPVMSGDAKGDFDISWCRFATATRLLCGYTGVTQVRGFQAATTSIAAVDATGGNLTQLIDSREGRPTLADDRVFDRPIADAGSIVVRSSSPESENTYLYAVELATGKEKQLKNASEDKRLWNVFTDGRGNIRLAEGYSGRAPEWFNDPSGNLRLISRSAGREQSLYTSADGKEWRKLEKASQFAKTNRLTRIGLNAATGRAYGYATHNGRSALFEFDIEDKSPPQVGFAHPKVDVGDVVTDGEGRLIGVTYATDRPQVQYVDAALATTMRGINQSLPNKFNSIRSMSTDGKTLVIASRSDVDAGRFYLYETDARKLSPIGATFSKLDSKELASMRPIEFAARDGKTVPGYLTAPPGDGKNLPLVVLLHEGQSRAHWSYDELTQYLATRGYAVLTVNHRGSGGYGTEWLESGKGNWGGVVYDDVTDGTRWAVAQGIADPKRICLIGRGANGYTALLGAMRNADLFKCAGSIGGRSDLVSPMRTGRGSSEGSDTDADDVKAQKAESPQRNADQFKIPVLLVHGSQDTRSPVSQSEEMAKALERAGKPHKFVKIERATQTFWRATERATVLREVEAFLAQNLRSGAE